MQWQLNYKKHCRVLPGTYCEIHDEPDPSNSTVAHTYEGIALGLTSNLQGSMKFYCLNTGRVLNHRLFTAMPMPQRMIKWVNAIGKCEKQDCNFCFLNRNKDEFDWTDEVPADYPTLQGLLEE